MKEGTFDWALEQLRIGKKVRRKHWCKSYFLRMNICGDILEMNSNKNFPLKYQSTQGKDWEIYGEEICHVCGKIKKPYIVFMNDDICNFMTHIQAREKGPICERCDRYFAMTGEFKEPSDKELKIAQEAITFARKMLEWWQKDKLLNLDESLREWEGTANIAKWYRQTYG